jgi:hypothetical protein
MSEVKKAQGTFEARLEGLERDRRRRALMAGVSILAAGAGAAWVVSAGIISIFPGERLLPVAVFVLFWTTVAVSLAAAARVALAGAWHRPGALAWELGMRAGSGSLIATAWEFSRGGERLGRFSRILVSRTIEEAGRALEAADPAPLFADTGRPRWTAAALAVAAAALLQILADPGGSRATLVAVSDPVRPFREHPSNGLIAGPGAGTVLSGTDAPVTVLRAGSRRDPVRVEWSAVPGVWQSAETRADTIFEGGSPLEVHRYVFAGVRDDLVYRFESGSERTAEDTIVVVRRPVINRIDAIVEPPPYLAAPGETIRSVTGRIAVPAGSALRLRGDTSAPLSAAMMRSAAGETAIEIVTGGFAGSMTVTADDTVSFSVTDRAGLRNEDPPAIAIDAVPDRPPTVEVIAPDDGAQIPRTQRVTVVFGAFDDHGLSRITLRWMRERRDDRFTAAPVPVPAGAARVEGPFELSLEDVRLLPGDRVLYYIEAADDNSCNGPGTARTPTRSLVVPSLSELFAESRERGEEQREGMDEILEEGKQIRERLADLTQEIRAEGGIDWSGRSEAEELAQRQEELRGKIGEAAERLDETLQRLEENRSTSMEIGRKMEEVRDLLERIENEQVREAIERMRSMLRDLPENEVAAAMEDLELGAEDLVQRLDRTIEMLRRLLDEQAVEEMMRRMEEMVGRQRDLRDSTLAGGGEETAERQDRLGDEYEAFERDLGELADRTDEARAPGLDEAAGKAEASAVDSMMRSAASDIRSGKNSAASGSQSGAISRMLSLYTRLGRCQMSMSMTVDAEVIAAVERAIGGLIEISRLQEEYAGSIGGSGGGGASSEDLIGGQLAVRDATRTITDDLYAAMRRSMTITEEVMVDLGLAVAGMDRVMEDLGSRREADAAQLAAAIPEFLNRAAIELLHSTSSGGGGSSGSGQGMQMMLEGQMDIDRLLRELMGQGSGQGMSMEQRAAMARIAAEQRRMDDLMRQIMEESGGGGFGDLSDIGERMRELARDLDEGRLDADVLDREEQILSRLLESQRSLTRRDYSRRRQSETAQTRWGRDPGGALPGPSERRELLEMIRRGMQQRGPAEFEELNRLYFRALSGKIRE